MKSKLAVKKLDILNIQTELEIMRKGIDKFEERIESILDQEGFIDKYTPNLLSLHIREIEIPVEDLMIIVQDLNQDSTFLLHSLANGIYNKKEAKAFVKKVYALKRTYDYYDKILDGQEDACNIEIDYIINSEKF